MDGDARDLREEPIDLRQVWGVLWRYKLIIATLWAVVVGAVAVNSFTATKIYRATAQLEILPAKPQVVSFEDLMGVDRSNADYRETQYGILQSPTLAEQVVDALKLAPSPEPEHGALARAFLSNLKIVPKKGSHLVLVQYEARAPELAARYANAVVDAYLEQNRTRHREFSKEAIGWLVDKIDELRAKLGVAEKALEDYKKQNEIITVEGREKVISQKLAELNGELIASTSQRVEAQTRYEQATTYAQQGDLLSGLPQMAKSPLLAELRGSEAKLRQTLSELSGKYGPKHPQMIRLRAELDGVGILIDKELRKGLASLKSDYEVAQAKESYLRKAFEQMKQEALELGEKSIQWNALNREVETNRDLYQVLLKRLEETRISQDLNTPTVRVVDRAEAPNFPVRPNIPLNLTLAALGGLLLGALLAFLMEHLDRTIKRPEDVESVLKVPLLGVVPVVKGQEERQPEGVRVLPISPTAEAFRSIRSGLLLSAAEHPPRTVVITSALPQEGKTFCSTNLAAVLAQLPGETLLIDADLRRPTVHRAFGLRNTAGLSNLLTQKIDPFSLVMKVADAGRLSVVTAGPMPPNPTDLLSSARMGELLQAFQSRFDWVVIDTPPLASVSDAAVLGALVEGVILVVRAGKSDREVVLRALHQAQSAKRNVLGAVANAVTDRSSRYYAAYYYGYKSDDEKRAEKKAASS